LGYNDGIMWICFKFPSLQNAVSFVTDISEGYRAQGINYVRSWEMPKRKKGGYAVAVCTDHPEKFEALAGHFSGQRMARVRPAD
jgi:hypothetical protein